MTDEERKESNRQFAEMYDVPAEDIVWGRVGISYGTLVVKTRKTAEKIRQKVRAEKRTANGGYFHGMALGKITEQDDGTFRVTH